MYSEFPLVSITYAFALSCLHAIGQVCLCFAVQRCCCARLLTGERAREATIEQADEMPFCRISRRIIHATVTLRIYIYRYMEMHDSHDGYFIRNESSNPPSNTTSHRETERDRAAPHIKPHQTMWRRKGKLNSKKQRKKKEDEEFQHQHMKTGHKNVTLILAFCRLYTKHQFNSADLTIDYVFLVSYSRYFGPSSMLRIPKPPSFVFLLLCYRCRLYTHTHTHRHLPAPLTHSFYARATYVQIKVRLYIDIRRVSQILSRIETSNVIHIRSLALSLAHSSAYRLCQCVCGAFPLSVCMWWCVRELENDS